MTGEESEIDEGTEEPSRFARFYEKNRRRFQLAALAIFLVAVAIEIGGAVPREVRVGLRFPTPTQVRDATIEYRQDDGLVRQVRRSFPTGAPREVRDTLELSPGDYVVEVVLTDETGSRRTLRGSLTAPADGVVRVALE